MIFINVSMDFLILKFCTTNHLIIFRPEFLVKFFTFEKINILHHDRTNLGRQIQR
jgi:hypothetical protein